jgi:hypothetical protein
MILVAVRRKGRKGKSKRYNIGSFLSGAFPRFWRGESPNFLASYKLQALSSKLLSISFFLREKRTRINL